MGDNAEPFSPRGGADAGGPSPRPGSAVPLGNAGRRSSRSLVERGQKKDKKKRGSRSPREGGSGDAARRKDSGGDKRTPRPAALNLGGGGSASMAGGFAASVHGSGVGGALGGGALMMKQTEEEGGRMALNIMAAAHDEVAKRAGDDYVQDKKKVQMRRRTSTRDSFKLPSENPNWSPGQALAGVAALALPGQDEMEKAANDPYQNQWLSAWVDSVANTRAFSQHAALADIRRDGNKQLIVADVRKKLKVFSDTRLQNEMVLMSRPVGLGVLYMDDNKSRTPTVSIAVGIDDAVYVYRNMRPYRIFRLPPQPVSQDEREVWAQFRSGKYTLPYAQEKMHELRRSNIRLSDAALAIISPAAANHRERVEALARQCLDGAPTYVACMCIINRTAEVEGSVGNLIVCTEDRRLLILDDQCKKVDCEIELADVAHVVTASGTLRSEDHMIAAASRDGHITLIHKGKIKRTIESLEAPCVSLLLTQNHVILGAADNTARAFALVPGWNNVEDYVINFPAPVYCMELLRHAQTTQVFVLAALANNEVRVYRNNIVTSILRVEEEVQAMKFGQYGRELNSLVLFFKSGSIGCKILSRKAALDRRAKVPPPAEENIPLDLPKKGKLYLEQVNRERAQGPNIHLVFKKELFRTRLMIMRAYAEILGQGIGTVNFNESASVRLGVQVMGLGPAFMLRVTVENTGKGVLENVPLSFMYHRDVYTIRPAMTILPSLVSGETYVYAAHVRCVEESGGSDDIKIIVSHPAPHIERPLITYVVKMPLSSME